MKRLFLFRGSGYIIDMINFLNSPHSTLLSPDHHCSSLLTPAVLHSPLILPAHPCSLLCSSLLTPALPRLPPLSPAHPCSSLLTLFTTALPRSLSPLTRALPCSNAHQCFTSLTLALHSPTNWSYTVFIRLYHISVKAKCSSLCNVSF